MVLSEILSPSDPDTDLPPSSTPDAYDTSPPSSSSFPFSSSSSSSSSSTTLPFETYIASLPRPFLIARLINYSEARRLARIRLACQTSARALGRPHTEDEKRAVAYHYARSQQIATLGAPVGMVLGYWRAWATRGSEKKPAWSVAWEPGLAKRDGSGFERRKVLKRVVRRKEFWDYVGGRGTVWYRMRHVIRASVYSTLGIVVGGVTMGLVGTGVMDLGLAMDERMGKWREEVWERVKKTRETTRGKGMQRDGRGGMGKGEGTVGVRAGREGGDTGMTDVRPDDAGDRYQTGTSVWRWEVGDGGMRSMVPASQTERGTAPQVRKPRGWHHTQPPHSSTATTSPDEAQARTHSSDSFSTDTDPPWTSTDDPYATNPSSSPSSNFGSSSRTTITTTTTTGAWERLRREAVDRAHNNNDSGSGVGADSTTTTTTPWSSARKVGIRRAPFATGGEEEGFAPDTSAEEKLVARNEAQRVFDEQVERERQGGEFGAGGGGKGGGGGGEGGKGGKGRWL